MEEIEYLTIQDVAKKAQFSVNGVRKHIREGKFPGFFLYGGEYRISVKDYEAAVAAMKGRTAVAAMKGKNEDAGPYDPYEGMV